MSFPLSRAGLILVVAAAAILLTADGVAHAQVSAAAAGQPVTTVWQRLGIPQTWRVVRDKTLNRRGNFPGLEKKPPLKSLADPANLESPNDAIKSAAEIKKEEDLAKQKIKALKYLATIGCGCYDKDGKVEKALLAGLEDCTPAVRMAAIDALMYMVQTCNPESSYGYSPNCLQKAGKVVKKYCCVDEVYEKMLMMGFGKKCRVLKDELERAHRCSCKRCQAARNACSGCCGHCCTLKVHKRLAQMAFEEKNGCYLEPVASIRAAALRAMCACPAPLCEEEEPEPTPQEAEDPQEEKKARKTGEGDDANEDNDEDDAQGEAGDDDEDSNEPEEITPPSGDNDVAILLSPKGANPRGAFSRNQDYPAPPAFVTRQSWNPPRRTGGTVSRERATKPHAGGYSVPMAGVTYKAVVELSSGRTAEAMLVMRNGVRFERGQRVVCTQPGGGNLVGKVIHSNPGKVGISLPTGEEARLLKPGSSVALRMIGGVASRERAAAVR